MLKSLKLLLPLLMVTSAAATTTLPQGLAQPTAKAFSTIDLTGRWRVKFILAGVEKNLVFDAKIMGTGSFRLLDTEPDNRSAPNPAAAIWSQLTNDRVSFSGEAELPIGTCCREHGTLIFKGKFSSPNLISGTLIFVTSVDEEESPFKFRSFVGSFTATRIQIRNQRRKFPPGSRNSDVSSRSRYSCYAMASPAAGDFSSGA